MTALAVEGGTVAGRYRLLRVVGTGGMGRVWLARDEVLARDVAVKEVVPIAGPSTERVDLWARTIREARTAARLSHPKVVRVYDVLFADARPWIVMEFVVARSLEAVVREDGPLPPVRAARVGLAVLDGLAAAHRAGVLHRDVKPQNVLIADDGRVLLGDFGVAAFDDADEITRELLLFASPLYAAPERIKDGVSTVNADLWSFGATLYWSVEGRPPYSRTGTTQQLAALAVEPPDPLRLAGALGPAIDGLLRRDPAHRLTAVRAKTLLHWAAKAVGTAAVPMVGSAGLRPTAGGPLVAASTEATGDTGVEHNGFDHDVPGSNRPTGRRKPAWRKPARRHLAAAAAGVVLVSALGVGAFASTRHHDGTTFVAGAATAATAAAGSARPVPGCGTAGPVSAAAPGDAAQAGGGTGPFTLPFGWAWHDDPSGFRLGIPAGWQRIVDGGIVCFLDPPGRRRLTVDVNASLDPDRVGFWQREEQLVRAGALLNGYQLVDLSPVIFGKGGADWEYSFVGDDGVRWHTLRRSFAAGAGRAFVLTWTTTDADWASNQPDLRTVAGSFNAL